MRRVLLLACACFFWVAGTFACAPLPQYAPASDGVLNVIVTKVTRHGENGYLPTSSGWAQIGFCIENMSPDVVVYDKIILRRSDKTTTDSVHSVAQLVPQPNTLATTAAGVFGGLAPLAGTIAVIAGASAYDNMNNSRRSQITASALHGSQTFAPGAVTVGDDYASAVDHEAILLFYTHQGVMKVLEIKRAL